MYPLTLGLLIRSKPLLQDLQAILKNLPLKVVLEHPETSGTAEFLEKLDLLSPELVLLEIGQFTASLEELIRDIKASNKAPFLIGVHNTADPQLILRAMKAGADEFVYPPLEVVLQEAITRVASGETEVRRRDGRQRGKVLGFLSVRGGCGATTLACHVAQEIHRQTHTPVMLADFDLDAGMVGFLMHSPSPYSLLDAAQNVDRLDVSFWKALVSNGFPGMEIISAPVGFAPRDFLNRDSVSLILRFMQSHYQWSLVDLGRGVNPLAMYSLEGLDEVFLITMMEVPTLHQTTRLLQSVLNTGFDRDRIRMVLNRVPRQPELSQKELEKMLGVPLYQTVPSEYQPLYEAYSDRKLAAPDSRLGRHFTQLARKITGVTEEKTKRKFSLFR